uniref:Uncharacterized protein n=1 Tax=Anguilla anguilla TaxID=7936 RepID=A0A0E9SVY3_ANGAN
MQGNSHNPTPPRDFNILCTATSLNHLKRDTYPTQCIFIKPSDKLH